MEENKLQDFALEDILKEFGEPGKENPEEVPAQQSEAQEQQTEEQQPQQMQVQQEQPEALEQTRRMEPVRIAEQDAMESGDTIRLEGLREELAGLTQKSVDNAVREEAPVHMEETICTEPFSERWEPEYEQPMGEYIPPQPIQFKSRSRLRELKRKLVAGPEKRFYELSEQGVGKLQAAIFLSLLVVLIAAASTAMYAFGLVQENRMRLMVFGQFLVLLISGLLGSLQMIEGIADLFKKRFTLNTLLAVTFLVCCADGVLCLRQLRVPCCAAFSLEVTLSLWGAYQRRNTEMSQMDTMRKATYLDGVAAVPDYLNGRKGLLRTEGQVEDFMDHYARPSRPEKSVNIYALVAMLLSFGVGVAAGLLTWEQGEVKATVVGIQKAAISAGIHTAAACLLVAVPASAFICQSRAAWILQKRLHALGTVLCGWQGVTGLCGKAVFPVTFQDLYPRDMVRLNGVKFFGNREPDQIVAYATAVVGADDCGLAGLFHHVLDSHNGRHFDAQNLIYHEAGGVEATVENECVLVGSAACLKEKGVTVPEQAKLSFAVYVAIENELCGLFAVSYEKNKSITAGLTTLNAYRRLSCVLTSSDFMLTHGFIKSKFGVKAKRFLLPEQETRMELREKTVEPGTPSLLMATKRGLAPLAYGVAGARVLRITSWLGAGLHIFGGIVGLAVMVLLVVLNAMHLLTPVNMFLYQLVWLIPALLISEWTRTI